jgi:hypothetical protein
MSPTYGPLHTGPPDDDGAITRAAYGAPPTSRQAGRTPGSVGSGARHCFTSLPRRAAKNGRSGATDVAAVRRISRNVQAEPRRHRSGREQKEVLAEVAALERIVLVRLDVTDELGFSVIGGRSACRCGRPEETIPGLQYAVKWKKAYYGSPKLGWIIEMVAYDVSVNVVFFGGAEFDAPPPLGSTERTRYVKLTTLEEAQGPEMRKWIKQAGAYRVGSERPRGDADLRDVKLRARHHGAQRARHDNQQRTGPR